MVLFPPSKRWPVQQPIVSKHTHTTQSYPRVERSKSEAALGSINILIHKVRRSLTLSLMSGDCLLGQAFWCESHKATNEAAQCDVCVEDGGVRWSPRAGWQSPCGRTESGAVGNNMHTVWITVWIHSGGAWVEWVYHCLIFGFCLFSVWTSACKVRMSMVIWSFIFRNDPRGQQKLENSICA